MIEEIIGMSNTAGGFLFLGVEDDGMITGVHKKHKDSIGVMALIANSTVPPISVRAEIIRSSRYLILSTSWRTHPRLEYMVFLQGI